MRPANLLPLRRWLFETEDCFAFLHQVQPIAGDGLQVSRVRLEEIHFSRLAGEQHVLLVHTGLQKLDLSPVLREPFMLREKETDDYEQSREAQERAQNAVELLPNGGFATRTEIAVAWMIH